MTRVETLPKDGSASTPPERPVPPAPGAPRVRDPFFDNAKFLLIVLVVIGHNWFPLVGHSRVVKAAYMVVYAFHMPAFILLSGYFSRNFEARPDQVRKLIKGVLLPYLIFEWCYLAVLSQTDGHRMTFDVTYPSYLTWFLIALFVWRLTTPVWRAVPRPVAVAVLVSLVAGLMNVSTAFALSRVLQFLPWFVAGLYLRPEHFTWLRQRAVRFWAAASLAAALPVAYLLAPGTDVDWLAMEWGANYFHVGAVEYLAIRCGLLAAGVVLVAAALSLAPRREMPFTALGTVTMYPYLLHGMIVKFAQGEGVYRRIAASGLPAVAALTVAAVLLALLLTTPPVRKVARWAVEPRVPWWLRAPLLGR